MNKSCLVKAHSGGLGSLLNNLILWMHVYENVSIDWSDSLYGPKTWESLFEPLPPPQEPFDTVCVFPDQWLTWRQAGLLYQGKDSVHLDWRQTCNDKWLTYFKVLPAVSDFVDSFVSENFPLGNRFVAAQIRWHGHAAEQLPPHRSQSWQDYAWAIEAEEPERIYIAASDEQTLAWFKERYHVYHHPTARRSPTRDTDFHRTDKQTERDAIDCLQEIMILSLADVLVHPISNLATAALYINPQLKSVYLP